MLRFIFLALLYAVSMTAYSTTLPITYFQGDERYQYETELLQHVLDLTAEEFGAAAATSHQYKTYIQGLRGLAKGEVDIAFLSTSQRHESNFLAVKVPLLQGMLGYRLFLINKRDKDKFKQIDSLVELKNSAVAGFGLHWEDLRVLYHNRLPVIANASYKELFYLLANSQVDYLPRGLNEIYNELEVLEKKHPNFILSNDLALYYPFVRYYFVHKENYLLAQRLQKGLAKAKADGSFKALFMKHFGHVVKRSKNAPHKVIHLANPFLPKELPKLETSWWLPLNAQDSLKNSEDNGQ